ncbi:LOB domain-containing protein 36-like [Cynara cardunculus var. scolymus]|uniref:Lateral organ boundaries domain-containing protein n=1 Tax=Cynara cardunculus var. scolymus TaxID=59895 RepID=A0A118K1C5_CYNCS|nr:LOB domain-containing protein 36-like [Cynara cardunculus var. scolymus]KVI02655.1 lateral organ boundaries domain-containing protein [Cynara cardunculus var. scolymus]
MSSSNSPCAACKFLRRKCTQECVFAPYFPPDQPQKFANVHKVFGASNVAKILNELNTTQREDAVNSLAYEAEARLRDPVYGCVGLISILQHRLKQVQSDLHNAKLELANYIGPSAMLPILNPGFIPQIPNMPSSSVPVLPYNMQPMMGMPGPGNFRDSQHHPQILEAQQQQLVAVANPREQQDMLRNYEQQQHPQQQPQQQQQSSADLVRFSGGFEAPGGSGQVTGGGFCPMTAQAAMSPSLALGSSYVNNMYQIQQQQPQQEQNHHLHHHLQPHQLLLPHESQQPPPAQRAASEEDRNVAPSC